VFRGSEEILDGAFRRERRRALRQGKGDARFRREMAEECGIGFDLPSVLWNAPKKGKFDHVEFRLSCLD